MIALIVGTDTRADGDRLELVDGTHKLFLPVANTVSFNAMPDTQEIELSIVGKVTQGNEEVSVFAPKGKPFDQDWFLFGL